MATKIYGASDDLVEFEGGAENNQQALRQIVRAELTDFAANVADEWEKVK